MEHNSSRKAKVAEETVPRLPVIMEEGQEQLTPADEAAREASCSQSTKPRLPENFNNLLVRPRLKAVKQFIGSFHYRHTAHTNFNAQKLRPLARIMDTARMIVYAPQPIKCVEAVFLALYLTAGLPEVERIPLGFKTEIGGQVYQHIVLLVQHNGKFGAFGISRCPNLMNKDLTFDSISSIVENFKIAYEDQKHTVLKIRVGLPVEHSIVSTNFVCWCHLALNLRVQSWPQCVDALETHAAKGKRLWDLWLLAGKGEDPNRKSITRKAPLNTFFGSDWSKKKKIIATPETSPQRMSLSKVQVESDIVAPYPTTVGNSKFRQSKSSSSAVVEGKKSESKMMSRTTLRNKLKLLRNLEQTLAVKRSFLKSTRSCKGTSAHLSSSKNVTPAPKLAARRKLAMIKCNSLAPTFARIRTRRSSVDCLPTNHKGSGSLIHS
ncbi:unnamed protein product [Sphagnum jensenii]|uniref:Vasohibin-2 n=1 Tax=Sphagnum jensenii TaxID=128206 RepID=A0ABP0WX19_9BRYO